MDLVVGATGLVGQQIALGLRRQGRDVRGLVRGGVRHEKAGPLVAAGVHIVDADLAKPETLPSACSGVDTVLCAQGDAIHDSLETAYSYGVTLHSIEDYAAASTGKAAAAC